MSHGLEQPALSWLTINTTLMCEIFNKQNHLLHTNTSLQFSSALVHYINYANISTKNQMQRLRALNYRQDTQRSCQLSMNKITPNLLIFCTENHRPTCMACLKNIRKSAEWNVTLSSGTTRYWHYLAAYGIEKKLSMGAKTAQL